MSEFWSNILQAVLVALVSALAPVLVGWAVAKARSAWLEYKVSNYGRARAIEDAVTFAVQAAEQLGLSGAIKDKREYAFQVAEKYLLDTYGLRVDIDVLYAKIEAEVWNEFNEKKETYKPAVTVSTAGVRFGPMTDEEADAHFLGVKE